MGKVVRGRLYFQEDTGVEKGGYKDSKAGDQGKG